MTIIQLPVPPNAAQLLPRRRFGCGQLAVELSLLARRYKDSGDMGYLGEKAMSVASTFWLPGSMLPWDIRESLRAKEGLQDSQVVNVSSQSNEEKTAFLIKAISNQQPPTLFIDQGVGHSITLWGVDPERKLFLAFDNQKNAKRNADGLTSYSYATLLHMWGRRSLADYALPPICYLIEMCSRASFSTRMEERLTTAPFTLVLPWSEN